MKASDIMTASPSCCSPDDSIQDAARTMRDCDCGSLPVVEDGCIVGIVTDRDLAVRALAEGRDADTKLEDVITRDPACCSTDDSLAEVQRLMSEHQVRRIPVVDADGCCVGIIAQADLARAASDGEPISEREIAIVVERISEPRRSSFDRGARDEREQRL
jgi:CBS domain-containing protein